MRKKWDIENARQLFLSKGYVLISDDIKSSTEKLTCINSEGYKVCISINKLNCNRTPTVFGNKNPYIKHNLQLFFDKHNIKSKILSENIVSQKDVIKFKCECGKTFSKKLSDILKVKTCRCSDCKYEAISIANSFSVEKAKFIIEQNSNLIVLDGDYKNQESSIRLKCECGNIFEAKYRKLRENNFKILCESCRAKNMAQKRMTKTHINYLNYMESINGYELIEYNGAKTPSLFYHKKCGKYFYMLTGVFKSGARCSCECNSRGERAIEKFLVEQNIKFAQQQTFKDCRSKKNFPLRYDFYLPNHNILIEYDGEFHYKEMDLRNSDLSYQQENDKIKDEYAKENNIKLLRIPYWEFDNIEEIILSVLNEHSFLL